MLKSTQIYSTLTYVGLRCVAIGIPSSDIMWTCKQSQRIYFERELLRTRDGFSIDIECQQGFFLSFRRILKKSKKYFEILVEFRAAKKAFLWHQIYRNTLNFKASEQKCYLLC